MIYQNGTEAKDLAVFNKANYTVGIQTDDEGAVGTQRTIIRHCYDLDRLLEMNLQINVLKNTHPDFTSEVQTTFALSVNETLSYKLPPIKDAEGNDVPEVLIQRMEAKEDRFPKFLNFTNSTRTLTFRPKDLFD